jgi:hypothetical protein
MTGDYRHTQWGILSILLLALIIVFMFLIAWKTGWSPVFWIALGILIVCMAAFSSLTVQVRGGFLEWRFGVGLIRKRIPVSEIGDAYAVRNPWYYGWGIQWTPKGWLYNVSGLWAVEVVLRNGRRFRVGTDRSEELAHAIRIAAGLV